MFTFIRSLSLVLVALAMPSLSEAQTWLRVSKGAYTINYQSGYEQDVAIATQWMDAGEALARGKFQVQPPTVRLWLHPSPMEYANVGQAMAREAPGKTTDIYYLTPSASAWKTTQSTQSVGLPFDDHYHAKTIVHEYTHAIQVSLDLVFGRYGEPDWYSEGLAEFNGIMHSDEYNRTVGLRANLVNNGSNSVQAQASAIVCCKTSSGRGSSPPFKDGVFRLTVGGDPYTGGLGIALFLQVQFGADIHRRVYAQTLSGGDFWSALEKETGSSLSSLWTGMRAWYDREIKPLSP